MADETTRDRILNTASEVFCKKGFENTTIRDICTEAEANVAAVNYHFGDKQKLYYAVLTKWMHEFVDNDKMIKEMESVSTPEEKLRVFIRTDFSNLCTYNDPTGMHLNRMRMLLREITVEDHDPAIFECHQGLEEKILHPIIRDIVGPLKDEKALEQAYFVATSISTQYFIMLVHQPDTGLKTEEDLEYMTDYVTQFVIGGLKAIKEKYHA